jgi:hypothetical protein
MKRTLAAVAATAMAGASIGLAGAPAYAKPKPGPQPMPSARVWVRPKTTFANGGKVAVMSWCSGPRDLRVITTGLLPHAVNMHKSGPLEIKVTNKTKPGKYTVTLWCVDPKHQTDAIDQTQVTVLLKLKGWKQHWQGLPGHFKPAITASSAPPPPPKKHTGKHGKGH